MAPRIDDRYLWLGFGTFLFFAARGIRSAITETLRLTEIDPTQYEESEEKNEQPEDSITTTTLRTLALSPNPSIASAATSLIISRFAQLPNAADLLAADSKSPNETLRFSALTAIYFLKAWPSPLNDNGTALDSVWGDERRRAYDDFDGWRYRPVDEVVMTPGSMPGLEEVDEEGEGLVPNERESVAGWVEVPRERGPQHDESEEEIRTGRREAMVLHEGDGRVEAGDIIRPQYAAPGSPSLLPSLLP